MSSHPSPFNRKRQSTKALDPSGHTVKFLYEIIKQVDLKFIDWARLARNLDISNGHAARMRYSRFRAQIEGHENSYVRRGQKKKGSGKKKKKGGVESEGEGEGEGESDGSGQPKSLWDNSVWDSPDMNYGMDMYHGMKVEDTTPYGAVDGSDVAGFNRSESLTRSSFVNGVAVHHPTMTTVTVPPSSSSSANAAGSSHVRRTSWAHQAANDTTASALPIHERQREQSYDASTSSTLAASEWQQQQHQQYLGTGHRDQSYQVNMNVPSSAYRVVPAPAPALYTYDYYYPVTYGNQPQRQQHQQYYQYQTSTPIPRQQSRVYSGYCASAATTADWSRRSPSAFAYAPTPTPSENSYSNAIQDQLAPFTQSLMPTPTTTFLDTSIQGMTPVQARELASQVAYPWPYSETALSSIMQSTMPPPPMLPANVVATTAGFDSHDAISDTQMLDLTTPAPSPTSADNLIPDTSCDHTDTNALYSLGSWTEHCDHHRHQQPSLPSIANKNFGDNTPVNDTLTSRIMDVDPKVQEERGSGNGCGDGDYDGADGNGGTIHLRALTPEDAPVKVEPGTGSGLTSAVDHDDNDNNKNDNGFEAFLAGIDRVQHALYGDRDSCGGAGDGPNKQEATEED